MTIIHLVISNDYPSNAFNYSFIFEEVKAFCLKILVSNVLLMFSKCVCLIGLKLVGKLSKKPH